MGANNSEPYVTAVSEKKEGQTPIYRNITFPGNLRKSLDPHLTTMKKTIKEKFTQYAGNNCLGKIIRNGDEAYIERLTYKEVFDRGLEVGSALISENLTHQNEGQNMKFVGIFSKNRPEWTIVDVGCVMYNIVTVPIYDTLGDENISFVLNHSNLTTCFVNQIAAESLRKTKDLGNLKTLIHFDEIDENSEKEFQQRGIKMITIKDMYKIGSQSPISYNHKKYDPSPNDCLTFSYTSGTTGPPKGAMISHENFTSLLIAAKMSEAELFQTDRSLSYLPLPHIMERAVVYLLITSGGEVISYSGDITKIKDDLALVQPTIFVSVPRIFNRFYDMIKLKFDEFSGLKKGLVNWGVSAKQNQAKNGVYNHMLFDALVFNKVKAALGGKVRYCLTASAPLRTEVQNFLKIVFSCPFLEVYGQTQSTGLSFITRAAETNVGHVGGPVCSCEYKLTDIPEMNYLSEDKDEEGRPRPRGEICMRGPGVFLGYYKDPQKTKEAKTEDGWLMTGDVGVIEPDGLRLRIIDRKKNIFKLSQGEYVAPEKIEALYLDSKLISEVFLHGDSTQNFALVFASPNRENFEKLAAEKGIQGSYAELCANPVMKAWILADLNKLGVDNGLKPFEQAKNIYLEANGFSSRGILTNTMKVQRFNARVAFKKEISELYKEGMVNLQGYK